MEPFHTDWFGQYKYDSNSWIYLTSTYYWWLLRPTITIRFEISNNSSTIRLNSIRNEKNTIRTALTISDRNQATRLTNEWRQVCSRLAVGIQVVRMPSTVQYLAQFSSSLAGPGRTLTVLRHPQRRLTASIVVRISNDSILHRVHEAICGWYFVYRWWRRWLLLRWKHVWYDGGQQWDGVGGVGDWRLSRPGRSVDWRQSIVLSIFINGCHQRQAAADAAAASHLITTLITQPAPMHTDITLWQLESGFLQVFYS